MRTILIMIHSKYYYRSVVTQGIHPLQFIWLWFMVFLLIYLEILSLFSWIFAMLFCGHCFCVFQLFSCYKSCIHSCSLPVSYEPVSYKKTCTSALMLGWWRDNFVTFCNDNIDWSMIEQRPNRYFMHCCTNSQIRQILIKQIHTPGPTLANWPITRAGTCIPGPL